MSMRNFARAALAGVLGYSWLIAFSVVYFLLAPYAWPQQTKSQLNTEVNTNFPNNTSGLITPTILRQTVNDIIASFQQAPAVIARASATDTILVGDFGQLVAYSASPTAVTLPQATGSFANFNVFIKNTGGGTITVTPTVSTIDGAASLAIGTGNGAWIVAGSGNYTSYTSGSGGGGGGGGVTQFNGLIGAVTTNVVVQRFFTNSVYVPTSGMLHAIVECIGSGGGGGGATGAVGQSYGGAGGSSGGYSMKRVTAADVGASQTITINAAGTGGAGSNNGTAGGSVSVGSLCVANGGPGGVFGSGSSVPVSGGVAAAGTGDIAAQGNPGMPGLYSQSLVLSFPSGNGASSALGGGAVGVFTFTATASGNNAGSYGAGGSGAYANNVAASGTGGNGSTGVVIITEFINM